ncbi:MAG: hypothetical protein ACHQ0J_11615 [Candidatus Dormibacterales bacterium]
MTVEVDRPSAVADGTAHNARLLHVPSGSELDNLGRKLQMLHRFAQNPATLTERASGRVLGVNRNELLQELGHLVCPRLQPTPHLSGAIHHELLLVGRLVAQTLVT